MTHAMCPSRHRRSVVNSNSGRVLIEEKQTENPRIRIGVIAERRYLSQAQPNGMVAALRQQGRQVDVVTPDDICYQPGNNTWFSGIDIAIARGRSWGVLCLLQWIEQQGIPVINSRCSIAAVHNKAEMAVALASAGIPTPRTFLGNLARIASCISAEHYPLILKPVFGDNCSGLQVVSNRAELLSLHWPEPLVLAQQFIPGCDSDLKLYCIGSDVWAVRKPSPLQLEPNGTHAARNGASLPALVPITPALRDLAWRCGAVFGLEIFGVDCITTTEGPLVIEVNEFPNYSAVPDADEKLANFILSRTRQEATI
jgi:ribosomal protein S6--L-glutamate ligase